MNNENIKMRGSQKNINYQIKWTPEFAYAIGLLTTDGNLSKDGRHLDFTSQDIQLVKTFGDCMDLVDIKIGAKISGPSGKTCPHVQFSNVRLYKWLLRVGLMPNKSKKIGAVKIPDEYFFDFLRGHFDGDGSCFSYWDKRWPNSFMFYVKFCSASKKHILWLRSKLKNLLGINGSIDCSRRPPRAPLFQLKYAKNESKILISKMYYKKDLPCLKRKYLKLKSILETNEKQQASFGRASAVIW